jgi:hypothetical protein
VFDFKETPVALIARMLKPSKERRVITQAKKKLCVCEIKNYALSKTNKCIKTFF